MKYLDKYVQVSQEGRPYPILCHGDQLSKERMIDAKLFMAFSEDEADQLRGLIPRPQGFHKRCIVLQDSMNRLFSGSTVGDKGSLFHIKNKFGFRPVKKKISDCVNSVVDLFNFVTEASICLIVCDIINIENVDDMCDTIPADDSVATKEPFSEICTQITDLVWPHVDFKSIQQALSGDDDQDATSDVEDPRFQDDTLLYWDADTNSLDETMPYYESSEDNDFGKL